MSPEEYFAENRYNVELQFTYYGEEDGTETQVRVRPWKGKPNDGKMVLACAITTTQALQWAMELVELGAWEELDWSRRIMASGTENYINSLKRKRATNSPLPRRTKAQMAAEIFDDDPLAPEHR